LDGGDDNDDDDKKKKKKIFLFHYCYKPYIAMFF